MQWARDRKSVNLRHELELTLMSLYYKTSQYKKAEGVANDLYNETKKLQDKEKTVKVKMILFLLGQFKLFTMFNCRRLILKKKKKKKRTISIYVFCLIYTMKIGPKYYSNSNLLLFRHVCVLVRCIMQWVTFPKLGPTSLLPRRRLSRYILHLICKENWTYTQVGKVWTHSAYISV